MAYILSQQPSETDLTSTLQPVIFTVSDVAFTGFKYRFALKISNDAGQLLTTLALQPNNNDAASFNIAQVLDSYVKTTEIQVPDDETSNSIHRLGTTDLSEICAKGAFTARKFTVDVGYIKSSTSGGSVSYTPVSIGNKVFAIRWSGQTSDFSNWNGTKLNGLDIGSYTANSLSFKPPMLSEIPQNGTDTWPAGTMAASPLYKDNVTMKSFRTLATPTGTATGFDLDRNLNFYRVRVMNGTTQVGIFVINISTAGGVASSSVGSDGLINFVGTGPINFKLQTANTGLATAIQGTWTHYDIIANQTSTASIENQLSGIYRYTLVPEPCLYDQFTIAFLNRAGTYDYIDVLGSQTNTTKVISKNKYVGKSGNYIDTSATDDWTSYGRNGGTTFRDVTSKRGIKAKTGWYDESRDVLIESLTVSRQVVMINTKGDIIPIVISDTNYLEKTSLKNRMFQYDINIEFAKERVS
tara:strand:+ start:325 stop:1728 length:1404 start_codon:yes stop_codon:yes gene_type:complete